MVKKLVQNVYYLGPQGTFCYEVAKRFRDEFFTHFDLVSCQTVDETVKSLTDIYDFAVIPVENNVEGVINRTIDLLISNTNIKVVSSYFANISFDLVGKASTKYHTVFAHPHAMSQCQMYISKNNYKMVSALSNTASLKDLDFGDVALVPSKQSSSLCKKYGLKVIDRFVQDYQNAKTQFLIIHKIHQPPQCINESINNRTILHFIPSHTGAGSLLDVLQIFKDYDINMTDLITRPIKAVDNQYEFVVVIEGNPLEKQIKDALKSISQITKLYRIIGSYKVDDCRSDERMYYE